MSNRAKIIFSVTAIVLILILLGMTPLNFVHKIGAGCPFSKGKQALKCNPCPFDSILTQEDHGIAVLPLAFSADASIHLSGLEVFDSPLTTSNSPLSAVPLRC